MKQILQITVTVALTHILWGCHTTENHSPINDFTQLVAIDDLGRKIEPDAYPTTRQDKQVGIFYFLWLGCHGYDTPANNNDVVPPTPNDTQSPYNNQKAYAASPDNPQFGGGTVMHHWNEPYFGYYLSNDEWVMRRHAQMLAAGDTPFILRMPIIPGVNDNPAHFETAAQLVNGAKALQCVELLPYQRAAGAKYEMVGMEYQPEFADAQTPQMFTDCFEKAGIPYKVYR